MQVKFVDNSDQVLAALHESVDRALIICGMTAENYAKKLCPTQTGLLKNSITFALDGEATQISTYKADIGDKSGSYSGVAEKTASRSVALGTNVEYASYVELGTGAKNTPGGRPDPWGYIDDEGQAHHTGGSKAKPFLKPAVADHKNQYKNIILSELKDK
jgi:HK97 gp10 family phage protein